MTASTKNTDFRKFLRTNLRARFVRDENKEAITSVSGKTGKAQIQNWDTVMEALSENGKVIKETNTGTTFAFGKGKQKAEITLAHVGDAQVLTMKVA